MIIYSPLDGDAVTSSIPSNPRHCFLMTRLGKPVPDEVVKMRESITALCEAATFKVIDASTQVTGRDFLLKIWRLIASAPLSVGICHEKIPTKTQANIYYELGIAQALGKETIIVKSRRAEVPSDFVRTEYIEYDEAFSANFSKYLNSLDEQAEHYELVAAQLDRNPILAIDYLKRAFLISGDERLRKRAHEILQSAGVEARAKNSVEQLAASF
jgi:hypothetical protein